MPVRNNLIINSFDRSGSNAVIKVLAQHPDIEYFMNPFNSTNIRKRTNENLTSENATEEDYRFFKDLEAQKLEESYIKSKWFYTHSTTTKFEQGKLHILKTTLNHLSTEWVQKNFPGIEMWGIWRNPFDIIASIIRNNYYKAWYKGFIEQIVHTVKTNPELSEIFSSYLPLLDTDTKRLSFILSVKNYYFFDKLSLQKVINYDHFIIDPNAALQPFLKYFHLSQFVFQKADNDLNIVGKTYEPGKHYRAYIPENEIDSIQKILSPLDELVTKKFNNQLKIVY